jgi:hypothetical protein
LNFKVLVAFVGTKGGFSVDDVAVGARYIIKDVEALPWGSEGFP